MLRREFLYTVGAAPVIAALPVAASVSVTNIIEESDITLAIEKYKKCRCKLEAFEASKEIEKWTQRYFVQVFRHNFDGTWDNREAAKIVVQQSVLNKEGMIYDNNYVPTTQHAICCGIELGSLNIKSFKHMIRKFAYDLISKLKQNNVNNVLSVNLFYDDVQHRNKKLGFYVWSDSIVHKDWEIKEIDNQIQHISEFDSDNIEILNKLKSIRKQLC